MTLVRFDPVFPTLNVILESSDVAAISKFESSDRVVTVLIYMRNTNAFFEVKNTFEEVATLLWGDNVEELLS